jgi:hypothetical protein
MSHSEVKQRTEGMYGSLVAIQRIQGVVRFATDWGRSCGNVVRITHQVGQGRLRNRGMRRVSQRAKGEEARRRSVCGVFRAIRKVSSTYGGPNPSAKGVNTMSDTRRYEGSLQEQIGGHPRSVASESKGMSGNKVRAVVREGARLETQTKRRREMLLIYPKPIGEHGLRGC